ncbi:recombinase family protein [Rhodococcus sp. 06-156-3C]|uniref:recombinase family protein n=1 Tax=Nocardiaceae TaxID=85025 RepID=UPI0005230B48|nr:MULTISPECIES: recombinase family protein [Rhodococcus]OZD07686.1 recombinase family protein [Rhodococcus sp. 06-156-4C]OZD17102.1 recombinase family protein [Rhodococcus sp. 06-156-3C]OZD18440.1 recombinase family protein [Rhodococcus sp. 06-156-4a]OZD28359.1 recombinase family protein [Rhodococcus sp. 06-156-3]OZD29872.1 recombinase family protein [Rhodococcus sp. 06-156-3b]
MTVRAGIYCRISRDKAGEGLGVERQEKDCRALAERLGWEVAGVYVDNSVSAYSGAPRPGYSKLLQDIASGSVSGVLAWAPDRLHRSPVELEDYIALSERRDATTHTVRSGAWDLSSPSGRAVARTVGAWARYESEHKGDRIRRAREQAARAGKNNGGRRCYGYEPDGVTVRPAEAGVVAGIVADLLAGASLRAVVADLNERGVSTTTGRSAWTSTAVRSLVRSPRIAGLSTHHGEVVGVAQWPALVPVEQWQAIQGLLDDPTRKTNNSGGAVKWLGSGIYRCGVCGSDQVRVYHRDGRTRYRCKNRTRGVATAHVGREQAPLDLFVETLVVERLQQPDFRAAIAPKSVDVDVDVDALTVQRRAVQVRMEQLAGMFADGELTRAQLASGSERCRSQLDELDDQIARAVTDGPFSDLPGPEHIAGVWWGVGEDRAGGLSLDRRRRILDALMTVTILPVPPGRAPGGVYFRPEGVQIDWKVG